MKQYVSLGFKSSISKAELLRFAGNVVSRMSGNTSFAPLKTQIESELKPAFDTYVTALSEAADGSKIKIALKNKAAEKLVEALERIAAQVTAMADDSEETILESGFQVRKRTPRQAEDNDVGQVSGLQVRSTSTGEVSIDFQPLPNARSYGVEWSADGVNWTIGVYTTTRKAVLSGLPSGKIAWARVFAIGNLQRRGLPSAPVSFLVQ